MIRLVQYKTGKEIELPLLPEIGNAIIDYLKYSRQHSNESFVFLTVRSPIIPIKPVGISCLVKRAFNHVGIDTKNKHHGPHALRHSLAGRLFERQTLLPVLSEVLEKIVASVNQGNISDLKIISRKSIQERMKSISSLIPI